MGENKNFRSSALFCRKNLKYFINSLSSHRMGFWKLRLGVFTWFNFFRVCAAGNLSPQGSTLGTSLVPLASQNPTTLYATSTFPVMHLIYPPPPLQVKLVRKKRRDIGLVWELLAPSYGLSVIIIINYCFYLFIRLQSFSRCFNFTVISLTVTSEDVCCYIRNVKSLKS